MAQRDRLFDLARFFLRLGFFGFGGPAVHIAMMEEEVVRRRRWLTAQEFLDMIGAVNLVPGPNSTETAIHVGYKYAGWPGLLVAGSCFIGPAVGLTLILAWVYQRFGALPEARGVLAGIQVAVLILIGNALWNLWQKGVRGRGRLVLLLTLAVMIAVLLGVNTVLALFVAGFAGAGLLLYQRGQGNSLFLLPLAPLQKLVLQPIWGGEPTLLGIAAFFAMIGSILYGSGYVLFAYLHGWLVQDWGWLTNQQLLDAVAAGQLTPGPVLSTSAFIGYLLAGLPGGLVAALAIFTPSFIFVLILGRLLERLKQNKPFRAFLDAINAAAIGMIAAVLLQLALYNLFDWRGLDQAAPLSWDLLATVLLRPSWAEWLVLLATGFIYWRFKPASHWVVLLGAVAGLLL